MSGWGQTIPVDMIKKRPPPKKKKKKKIGEEADYEGVWSNQSLSRNRGKVVWSLTSGLRII